MLVLVGLLRVYKCCSNELVATVEYDSMVNAVLHWVGVLTWLWQRPSLFGLDVSSHSSSAGQTFRFTPKTSNVKGTKWTRYADYKEPSCYFRRLKKVFVCVSSITPESSMFLEENHRRHWKIVFNPTVHPESWNIWWVRRWWSWWQQFHVNQKLGNWSLGTVGVEILLEDAGGGLVTSGSILSPRKKSNNGQWQVDNYDTHQILASRVSIPLDTNYVFCTFHLIPEPFNLIQGLGSVWDPTNTCLEAVGRQPPEWGNIMDLWIY